MISVSPVGTEAMVEFERVLALDQPEYTPLIVMENTVPLGVGSQTAALVRFRLDDAERKAVAEGADLMINQLIFNGMYTPLQVFFRKEGEI